ncbi:N-acetylglutamate synthase-like GNAT family acetyltransferase [Deinobacterium chartae]|uniref:N-acetylglutamate synthase-like GNAT family acetyltransferase n=1 Tax=Deinobacterium chartae TaxID=521158 RepID=A0A841HY53_9DEIO|nr:GNAT family N-acetyltransferase [Deinobacterium chartae]MBB6097813.1 N-acetylglutamate synthase-like GNAT family acetyltransferase [Deinobacterium chartae]
MTLLTPPVPGVLPETHIRLLPVTEDRFDTVKGIVEACGLATASLSLTGSTFWLALLAGRPVGVIGLEHGEDASLLRSAAVLPEARGSGVGRALVLSALTLATLRGDRAVYLFSTEAGAYWQRFGFEQVAVAELEAALPQAPQVVSGQCRGWIHDEVAWRKTLATPEDGHALA